MITNHMLYCNGIIPKLIIEFWFELIILFCDLLNIDYLF